MEAPSIAQPRGDISGRSFFVPQPTAVVIVCCAEECIGYPGCVRCTPWPVAIYRGLFLLPYATFRPIDCLSGYQVLLRDLLPAARLDET